jgi:hypothetical protein
MVMEVVVGDNQRSRRWLAGYADHCPRGMMTDESTNQRMPWIQDNRDKYTGQQLLGYIFLLRFGIRLNRSDRGDVEVRLK